MNLASQPTGPDLEERIYREMLDSVLEQRLRPGMKLGEQWLAETYQISRARVRRVLLRLIQDQIVIQHPNRGAFVAQPSLAEAKDLIDTRRALEGLVIQRVGLSLTSHDTRDLKALIASEKKARQRGDRAVALKVGGEFHLKLAEFAGNRVTYGLLRDLVLRTSLALARTGGDRHDACTADDHPKILRALSLGERERAAALMDEHLRAVERSLWDHGEAQGFLERRRA